MKKAHLEMIQGVINRLSQNSFLLKGWSVILISGLLTLAPKNSKHIFILLVYFPLFTIWGLDGYFLKQERMYRKLYDKVRKQKEEKINFSMNTSSVLRQVDCLICIILSKTLIAFHGAILVSVTLIMYLIMGGN